MVDWWKLNIGWTNVAHSTTNQLYMPLMIMQIMLTKTGKNTKKSFSYFFLTHLSIFSETTKTPTTVKQGCQLHYGPNFSQMWIFVVKVLNRWGGGDWNFSTSAAFLWDNNGGQIAKEEENITQSKCMSVILNSIIKSTNCWLAGWDVPLSHSYPVTVRLLLEFAKTPPT